MQFIFRLIASFLISRPTLVNRLILRAMQTPSEHIRSPDGSSVYMYRYWLFNPVNNETGKYKHRWLNVSIRIHRIMRPDVDRHLHDHPWNAQSIILRNYYVEERVNSEFESFLPTHPGNLPTEHSIRYTGQTSPLRFGEFHRILHVPEDGVWTLFITFKYRGVWGFLVDGKKIPHREYRKLTGNAG